MRQVTYTRSALRTLRRIPCNEAERILAKVDQYAGDAASLANNVKALEGSPYIHLRIGDWRVIMDDRGNVLAVLQIGSRGSIYE